MTARSKPQPSTPGADAASAFILPPIERSFGFLLADAARLLRRQFDRRAAELGLTRAQWQVLAYLARFEGINQARLAEYLELQPITLVRLLDRLQEADWIERRADPADRRARNLYLTDKARPVLERMVALAAETREFALRGLEPAMREQLIDALALVRANLTCREGDEPEEASASGEALRHG